MAISFSNPAVSGLLNRNVSKNYSTVNKTLEKLASGFRVNKAADDVAALALGSRLNADLVQLQVYEQNTVQATSLVQIAEGALTRQQDMTTRLKTLAVQASDATLSDSERSALNIEFQALKDEINRVAADTKFNGQTLLNEPGGKTFDFTVSQGSDISATIDESNTTSLNLDALDISTQAGAEAALADIDLAAESIVENRASVGAVQNRLDAARENIAVTAENVDAARSAFLDANIAQEASRKATADVLLRASLSTLAQGNRTQSSIINLIS